MKFIAIKNGLFMFISFVCLFLFMHELIGTRNYNLRVLNGIFHLGFMYLAIRKYRMKNTESITNHVSGVAMGMFTALIGVIPFVVFMILYLMNDTAFMQHIQDSIGIGNYLTPYSTSLLIMVEGVVISLIGSYVLTRYIDMKLAKGHPEIKEQYFD